MKYRFTKMQGLGNDFVVFDGVSQPLKLTPDQIRHLADRHFGVGCDQVLVVGPAPVPEVDFSYRIFNADGSEVAQCGNGARCFARFVRAKGLHHSDIVKVATAAGSMVLELVGGDQVRVDMGLPRFSPEQIPLQAATEALLYSVKIEGQTWRFGAVSLGNPHAVITVPEIAKAPLETIGPLLQSHPLFPERVNVGFMEIVDNHWIRLRVYERGAGETLACGSGACAAAVTGIEQGKLESPVAVDLPGGRLGIEWSGRGSTVIMTGPAEFVFEGEIEL